jgi:hypothetical protein
MKLNTNKLGYIDKKSTHFDVKEAAVTLKNSDSEATALASMVLPLPGGPKRSKPKMKRFISFNILHFHSTI